MSKVFRLSVLFVALLALPGMAGAGEPPLSFNTNPLAERGISPEVLDVVVSLPSQGPGFEMVVDLAEEGGEGAEEEQVILVSDPFTRYGLDVYLVHDGPPPQGKAREWKTTLERMMGTAFRVRGEQRLYDPATVEILSEDDRETVIGFRYDKMRVPWPMRHLLKMTGRVHVVDGRLDRIELVAGEVRTESDVTLRLTQGFRNAVELLTGARLREFESFPASTSSTMLGAGLSTGFQHENLFGALSAQFATNRVAETGSELDILIATFLVGYDFGDIGLRVQTGAQYQDWDQVIIGTVPLGDGRQPLDFEIDLSSSKTSFLAGLTKEIGSNWNATLLAGTGARDQVTLNVGYRF